MCWRRWAECMTDVTQAAHRDAASTLRDLLAAYREAANLIEVGAYQPGSNPRVDRAMTCMNQITAMLKQAQTEHFSLEQTLAQLSAAVTPPAASPGLRRATA